MVSTCVFVLLLLFASILMAYVFPPWCLWGELLNETFIRKYPILVIDENSNASFIQPNANFKRTIMVKPLVYAVVKC